MTKSNDSQENLGRIKIKSKPKLEELIQNYYFYEFLSEYDIKQSKIFSQNIINSELVVIDKYQTNADPILFIITYQNTIIVIKISLIHLLSPLLFNKHELKLSKLYFIQDTKNILVFMINNKFFKSDNFMLFMHWQQFK